MGYRSDVALRFSDHLVEVVNTARKLDKELDSMLKEAQQSDTDYFWEHIKWYDSYKDVQAVQNFLNLLQADDYGMIRIGEEPNDIECDGDPCQYNMYPHTTIEW